MEININHLKYFFDTVNLGSANQAAKVNHVSQPAISQGIRKLEDQLGINLLEHKKNTIIPTQDSQYLLSHVAKVFSSIEDLKDKIDCLKTEVSGVIRLGVSSSLAKFLIIPKISAFEKKYPHIELKLKIGKTQNQIDQLEKNEIDVGITIDNGHLSRFHTKLLYKGEFVLAGRESSAIRFLATEDRLEVRKLREVLKKSEHALSSLEVESWDLLYEMAKNNLGYAFIPDVILQHRDKLLSYNKKFKIPKISYEVVSISHKDKTLNRATKLLLEQID